MTILAVVLLVAADPAGAIQGRTTADYRSSCDKCNEEDCNTIGYMLQHGVEVAQDEAKAADLFADRGLERLDPELDGLISRTLEAASRRGRELAEAARIDSARALA